MIDKLVLKNRSYRRFQQERIGRNLLEEFINLARLSPSAANQQVLRFYLSNEEHTNTLIFEHLAWAGYLKDWTGPEKQEQPTAYILILAHKNSPKAPEIDAGIAAQSILLGAVESGLGGCIVGSVQKEQLHKQLALPEELGIVLVLAIGKPKEEILVEDMEDNNIKYWRDQEGRHHVPKRRIADLIINPEKKE